MTLVSKEMFRRAICNNPLQAKVTENNNQNWYQDKCSEGICSSINEEQLRRICAKAKTDNNVIN